MNANEELSKPRKSRRKTNITIKRVYDAPGDQDGMRILVDRLWPRGLTRDKARVDVWLKDIAPSTDLRKWFGHDPAKWLEFRKRYLGELKTKAEELSTLKREAAKGKITLLYGARDEEHNEAVVLEHVLQSALHAK